MKRLRFPALVLLFSIFAMLFLFAALPAREYSPTERRYLAKAPAFSWQSLRDGEWSKDAETYVSDHFPGRNLFVGINAYWNLLTGRNTTGSIYYGKEHYLIHAPETSTTEQFAMNLSRFDQFAQSAGLPASLLMIPAAGDILEDKLPAHHAPYRYTECLSLAQDICQTLAVPDLKKPLEAAARTAQVYYKTDHHLTSAGCHAVYETLCQERGQTALSPEDYTVTTYEGFHGTTWASSGYWLTGPDRLETWDSGADLTVTIQEAGKEDILSDSVFFPQNLESDDLYTIFLDGNHALVHIQNPAVSDGALLMLRDSYGHCMAPFFAGQFRDIILVDLRYYRNSISKLIQDYHITELFVLYGLDSLLTDSNSAWLF